ncbi:MAG: Fur family transcriptional regulator [Polyangiales bacterium]
MQAHLHALPAQAQSALRRKLNEYMQAEGLRSTAQRRLVSEVFFTTPGHWSIEELLAEVRKADAKVGYATVYRTLKLLAASGVAQTRHFGDGVTRYELAPEDEHHDHIICLDCGAIVEFEDASIEQRQDERARELGFRIERHKFELYCRCELAEQGCPRRRA